MKNSDAESLLKMWPKTTDLQEKACEIETLLSRGSGFSADSEVGTDDIDHHFCTSLIDDRKLLDEFLLRPSFASWLLYACNSILALDGTVSQLIWKIATDCSPKEAFFVLESLIRTWASLEYGYTGWTEAYSTVCQAAAEAFSRTQRKPLALLDDLLESASNLLLKVLSTSSEIEEPSSAVQSVEPARALSKMLNCLHGVADAVAVQSNHSALCEKLHCYELGMLDIVFSNQQLRPGFAASSWFRKCPAQLRKPFHIIFDPDKDAQGLCSFIAISISTILLKSGYFANRKAEEDTCKHSLCEQRGRAFAVFCLVCTEESWVHVDEVLDFAQPDSLNAVAKMSCTLLSAANEFQALVMAYEGFALATAGASRIRSKGEPAQCGSSTLELFRTLGFIMGAHGIAEMRTAACQTTEYVLQTLKITKQVDILEELICRRTLPNQRAMALQMLQHMLCSSWNASTDKGTYSFLEEIPSDRVQDFLMFWIDSEWSADNVREFAEPIYTALNLFWFILLRNDAVRSTAAKAQLLASDNHKRDTCFDLECRTHVLSAIKRLHEVCGKVLLPSGSLPIEDMSEILQVQRLSVLLDQVKGFLCKETCC
eukprot:jgi/Botrbrau1/4222/Bobra.0044s0019.1